MVRHYEALGLLPEVARTDNGYRQYTANDVHTLRFIRRCRDLGFSIEEIRQLLALWRDKLRASAQVKHIAQAHIHQLNERIAAMQASNAACKRSCLAAKATNARTAPSWTIWAHRFKAPRPKFCTQHHSAAEPNHGATCQYAFAWLGKIMRIN